MNNKGIFRDQIISNFDWVIFGLTIVISVVGIFTIYSTGGSGGEPSRIYIKQIYWILYGLMAMLLILFIDYHSLEKLAYILYFLFILAGSAIISLPFLWHFMKDYQRNRILTLINPQADPLGSGYHIIQSKIAIGSGGYMGKGFMSGTQSQLNFLPEKHTDFIFSVFAEEMGFIGALLLIALYVIIIIKGIDVVYHARDRSGSLMAGGVVSMLAFHMIFNIGMTTGMFPVVGIPLPLMSYGGSYLVTTFISIGLLLNIKMRRFVDMR